MTDDLFRASLEEAWREAGTVLATSGVGRQRSGRPVLRGAEPRDAHGAAARGRPDRAVLLSAGDTRAYGSFSLAVPCFFSVSSRTHRRRQSPPGGHVSGQPGFAVPEDASHSRGSIRPPTNTKGPPVRPIKTVV
jgi:hypothetical protein